MAKKVIGSIAVNEVQLFSETTDIAQQWSENLQIQVNFEGTYWSGYALVWLYAHNSDMAQTGICKYDPSTKILTLPLGAFEKDGYLYLSLRGLKDDEVITSLPIYFYINTSGNPVASNTPREPGWEEIAKDLMEQIFANEYKKPLADLIINTQKEIDRIISTGGADFEQIKSETTKALEKLRVDYANTITIMADQYEIDITALLEDASKKIQTLKDTATAAIDIMIRNANTDFKNLKEETGLEVDALKDKAQQQQLQIDNAKTSMGSLQADLIDKRDSGFFDGKDGVTLSSGMLSTLGIEGEDLCIYYPDGGEPPNITLEGENLIWMIE